MLFGAMGFFFKNRQIRGGQAEKPQQPIGCEDFEVKDNEKYQEIFKKKLSNTF